MSKGERRRAKGRVDGYRTLEAMSMVQKKSSAKNGDG